ncbi:2-oxoglutarate dehydrogenase E1 component [Anatilimnocola sp. NA78]|uniref:2-oxoglutarate dehydrogenase E1 component n=1 Tax=Anatilimnocola sp. NA78 TaxID=3415683 RepID=UPI003CE4822A
MENMTGNRSLDFFQRANGAYLELLYTEFKERPDSLDPHWALFFAGFEAGYGEAANVANTPPVTQSDLSDGVSDLAHSYRELGHFEATLDPLGHARPQNSLLSLAQFGLTEEHMSCDVGSGTFLGPTDGTLRSLLDQLRQTYCANLGVEFMHIASKEQRDWLVARIEPHCNVPQLTNDERRRVLDQLLAAETFETFLHTKYVGQKRFSIEGSEALIPLLEAVIEDGAAIGVEEVVMGMSHRGRLNVLAHVLHKPYEFIMSEFEGTTPWQESEADGDVKYHLGFSNDRTALCGHPIHTSLSYNPSHLELVDPVIQGIVRAKQQRKGDEGQALVLPMLLHGEAAFTGQGIVPETLSLSELPAYRTGGTIHVIVNNQVGFTATADQTRFTPYATDVALMIQAPVFHVNGDDPEAVVHAAKLAIAFRQQFNVDVLIDLWCYRRRGHNEADEPAYTQPRMYAQIAQQPSVVQLYAKRLLGTGDIDEGYVERTTAQLRNRLNEAMKLAKQRHPQQKIQTLGGLWTGLSRGGDEHADTVIGQEVIDRIVDSYLKQPDDFAIHPKLKFLTGRREMAQGTRLVDWGCGEMLSLGSLLLEGTSVRLMGQDSERGTFSHRHAVLHDARTDAPYIPLQHLSAQQGSFTIRNSMLSELAVLGFEYGFSSADPHTLVIWEAQFGDFANGAQAIIDQFLVSAESKWLRMSGLVLLLPHGYEGQGPEHSSARLERFLQLCGDNNIQVCYPTRSAQYFHLLRRQMRRSFRKPLIIMSPKSLLRDERAASSLAEFTQSSFQPVLGDPQQPDPELVRRLVFCSGRVFYPLDEARQKREQQNLAIVRIEQLYPFPQQQIRAALAQYRRLSDICWLQEEPRNMGAWSYLEPRLRELLPKHATPIYIGRDEAASPATGIFHVHEAEEKSFIEQTLDIPEPASTPAAVKSA